MFLSQSLLQLLRVQFCSRFHFKFCFGYQHSRFHLWFHSKSWWNFSIQQFTNSCCLWAPGTLIKRFYWFKSLGPQINVYHRSRAYRSVDHHIIIWLFWARIACTRKVQRCNWNTYNKLDLGVEYLRASIRRKIEFTDK